MDTSETESGVATPPKRSWRRHSEEFEARVIELARQPSTSVAAVALANGLNANMLRRWLRDSDTAGAARSEAGLSRDAALPAFVQLPMPTPPSLPTAAPAQTGGRVEVEISKWNDRACEPAVGQPQRCLAARGHGVIRVDAVWMAVQPLDMRLGTEAALARVVTVFGSAHPHHAYLFANRRANRMKVLVHDGIGVWLAARRLNAGKFVWLASSETTLGLSRPQFDALVLGLPWQRLGEAGIIRVI